MPLSHLLLGIGVALLWGANFVVMKYVVSELPPLATTAARFLLASIPLVFFVPKPDVPWRSLLGFGFFFGVVKFSLLFTAFKLGMPAGLAAMLLQLQVLFTIVFAFFILAERPRPLQWLGLAIALAGAAVIIAGRWQGAALVPVFMTLAAALAWGAANIFVKQAGAGFDPLGYAVWTSFFPALAMSAIALFVEGPAEITAALATMSWRGIGALAYLAYPISILSGSMWSFLMIRHSAATVAPFALLVPVLGAIGGWLVFGEQFTGPTIAGGALILVGLGLNVLPGRRATEKPA